MTLRRDRKRGRKKSPHAHRFTSICSNCGEPGPHYVPPTGAGRFPGFFACERKADQ